MCVSLNEFLCTFCVQVALQARKLLRIPRKWSYQQWWVTSCEFWDVSTGPSEEQCALLSVEASL